MSETAWWGIVALLGGIGGAALVTLIANTRWRRAGLWATAVIGLGGASVLATSLLLTGRVNPVDWVLMAISSTYVDARLMWPLALIGAGIVAYGIMALRGHRRHGPKTGRIGKLEKSARVDAVAAGIRGLLVELGALCEEVEGTGKEQPLVDWKRRAKRFLDANLASDKVTSFHALATEVTRYESNQPRDHIRSSCAAHRRFLRELLEDVVAGYEPVTDEEAPSGRGIPPTKSFIWQPDDGR